MGLDQASTPVGIRPTLQGIGCCCPVRSDLSSVVRRVTLQFIVASATLLTLTVVPTTAFAQNTQKSLPSPVMEFSSVLSSLDVIAEDGRLALQRDDTALTTVFLPKDVPVDVVITKAGSATPLHVQPMEITWGNAIFSRAAPTDDRQNFRFTEPGDYVATFRVGEEPMTVVPFRIDFESLGTQFNPLKHVYASGPWSKWGYLFASVKGKENATPRFRMWARIKSFDKAPDAEEFFVEVRKEGELVAVSEKRMVDSRRWQRLDFELRHPDAAGGQPIEMHEFVDGDYDLTVFNQGNASSLFRFTMNSSKPRPHPQQAFEYEPRTEYLVPRFPGLLRTLGKDSMGHITWVERQDVPVERPVASPDALAASNDKRKRWSQSGDLSHPERAFSMTITDIETRTDTSIACGNDLVVFGTGYPRGVQYIKVGDTFPRDIPGGNDYSSSVFHICGQKIVLAKRSQIVIYDTATGTLTEIPESYISLYAVRGGLHRANLTSSDGYLIATVNKASSVSDGAIIKVIDVSEAAPRIITINNGDFSDSDITSIAVDAKQGLIAASLSRKGKFVTANIGPLAVPKDYSVKNDGGVGNQQIRIGDERILYVDNDRMLRSLNLSDGVTETITDRSVARSGNGFDAHNGRVAVTVNSGRSGARFPFAVADLGQPLELTEDTGTSIEGTGGALGLGGCAAIADDNTVFIAGTPGGGIERGEHLQLFDVNGQWRPVTDFGGNVVAAIDVTTGSGLVAFKARNAAANTVIGYATYGQNVNYPTTTSTDTASAPVPETESLDARKTAGD